MIYGIGTDVLSVCRFFPYGMNYNDVFFLNTFTIKEREYTNKRNNAYIHYATIFSGKEAIYKALSKCNVEFRPKDIEILHDEKERPYVQLSGKTKEYLDLKIQKYNIKISLSYDDDIVVAFAIIEDC